MSFKKCLEGLGLAISISQIDGSSNLDPETKNLWCRLVHINNMKISVLVMM